MAAMVSTGKWNSQATTEASTTAINIPGQFGSKRLSKKIKPAEPAPTANAAGLRVGNA
jgi:hypothetical protein